MMDGDRHQTHSVLYEGDSVIQGKDDWICLPYSTLISSTTLTRQFAQVYEIGEIKLVTYDLPNSTLASVATE